MSSWRCVGTGYMDSTPALEKQQCSAYDSFQNARQLWALSICQTSLSCSCGPTQESSTRALCSRYNQPHSKGDTAEVKRGKETPLGMHSS